jgi:hypothetical protein
MHAQPRLPMYFERNLGQTDAEVAFIARGAGGALFITATGAVALLRQGDAPPVMIRMKLIGANQQPTIEGRDLQEGKSHYLIGNDASKWRTDVPHFGQVRLAEVYKGIALVYYGNQRQLEYDFVVRPGADPRQIRLHFEGPERVEIDRSGDLVLRTGGGEIRQRRPVAYQNSGSSRRIVRAGYRRLGKREFGIDVAPYDAGRPLVIDPIFEYSTYLGGMSDEGGSAIAVDTSGNVYVAGWTRSANLPTANPLRGSLFSGEDAFVAKFNPSGSALIYSTYLGGGLITNANAIAVDGEGNAYVGGTTRSRFFPTANPLQPDHAGGDFDGFVTKINPSGSALVYSTFLGGASGVDRVVGIALDGSGNAYVAGTTNSTNFPTVSPLQANNAGDFDAFVTKFDPAGSALVYSTYLGGSGADIARGIAADGAGNAYVAGETASTNFPASGSPLQGSNAGATDAFVTKINASGSALAYSTYVGGSSDDSAAGITVDSSGNAYIAGETWSPDYPTASSLQPFRSIDAFVTKINASGSALVYSTYLGGSLFDAAVGIAVDSSGNAHVAGQTNSSDFPTARPPQSSRRGLNDAFVAGLDASGSFLLYSTYLGGAGDERLVGLGHGSDGGIAVDSSGNPYITGSTSSSNFPAANALQAGNGGDADVFVTKIGPAPPRRRSTRRNP